VVNWSRAKFVLIIAFLLLDVILAYRIWVYPQEGVEDLTVISSAEASRTVELLGQQGILVESPLPSVMSPSPFLSVAHETVNPAELARAFSTCGPMRPMGEREGGVRIWADDCAQLEIHPEGRIVYSCPEPPPAPAAGGGGIWDPVKARQVAEQFIKDHGGLPNDARYDTTWYDEAQDLYRVDFVQEYQGRYVFASRIRVLVVNWGVCRLERVWLEPLGYEGQRQVLLPVTDTLLRLADRLQVDPQQPVVAEDVSLGFYSEIYDAETWVAPPVWRVRLSDGRCFYINAVTGELEAQTP